MNALQPNLKRVRVGLLYHKEVLKISKKQGIMAYYDSQALAGYVIGLLFRVKIRTGSAGRRFFGNAILQSTASPPNTVL